MRRFIPAFTLFACLAPAQAPQAPPEVDAALRERIRIFYQAHVDGKPRLADQVVAEDSKDLFFEMEKPRFLSFEILNIAYSDNFTRATAMVNCEREIAAPMFGKMRMKLGQTSYWKLVDGQWFWYVNPSAGQPSPFGLLKPGPPAANGSAPAPLPKGISLADLENMVRADKTAVEIAAGGTQQVTITNRMPGGIKLSVQAPKVPGFEAALDHAELVQNQSAVLTLRYQPKRTTAKTPAPAATAVIVAIEPSGQQLPIRVTFK